MTLPLVVVVALLSGVDVASYRTGRVDARVASVPPDIQQGVFAEPEQFIAPLVRWLVQGATDDFQKVKILHDWIAENIAYDVESYLAGVRVASTLDNTLRQRKAVCHGYSALLERMCRVADIPCKVIAGHGRGYDFGPGRPENVYDVNHAWNAVQIQGRWLLVDVTWDAGHVQQRSFQKQYSSGYLFLEPRAMLHTHFPSDPQWQLLDPPLTAEAFAGLPYLPGRFFELGLRLAAPIRRFHAVGESVQFAIESPPSTILTAQLKDPAAPDTQKFERRTLIRREGTRSNILVTFPKPGRWNVQILTKERREPGMFWSAATLEFESSAGTPWTFPETFGSYAAMDVYLFNPLYVPLTPGKREPFKIRVRGAEQVHLRIGENRWLPMTHSADDPEIYSLAAEVPPDGSVRIMAKEPGKDSRHWTLVDYSPEKNAQ